MTTKQDIKSVVYAGGAVDLDGVSICNLDAVLKNGVVKRSAKYQVWSDRHRVYDLFPNIDEAVNKFASLVKDKIHG